MENNREPHELRLDARSRLSVSGVREVESFDENTVVLNTVGGLLIVRGDGLHLQSLSIDGGQVSVLGRIDALSYAELQKAGGFFKRLLR